MKRIHKISGDYGTKKKTKGYKRVHDGYDHKDRFIFSSDLKDWQASSVRQRKNEEVNPQQPKKIVDNFSVENLPE